MKRYFVTNKRRAVAAQTARSRCKVLSIQYVCYFRANYQRQRTLHGVGVSTKLHFAIFAAFKESMTTGHSRSSILVPVEMSKIDNFAYPTLIPAKYWGHVPFGVDPSCWGLQRVKWLA